MHFRRIICVLGDSNAFLDVLMINLCVLCIFMHKYRHFAHIYEYFAAPAAFPAPTYPSIRNSTKGGRRVAEGRPPTFVEAAGGHPIMDGYVESMKATDCIA